ncbi:helix-turn-helix domain-containing protein [Paracoccus lutimaris]|uniref:Regulatory helix-turn-helix LysR family protein n=1 Tax=Paracoccus lutimaris TaxID=1490030 RepID=A0A368YGK2_9RHOB|nr:regulatory helix-turn-helix LysR family protein [Paracoccus lutimaris]
MRLEWLDDILAVADTGSMIRAAERRFLTQSAFSRRLRMIEEQLGVELFDRSRKPAELRRSVLERCDEMRGLARYARKLVTLDQAAA